MIGAALKGADAFSRMLARKARQVKRSVDQVNKQAADKVAKSAQRRAKARRGVTDQDHRAAVNPRPPRIARKALADGGMGVQMGGQWGHARDPVIVKAMRDTGNYADLVRKHLWVKRPLFQHILGPDGVQEREKLRFKDHPWLEEWGEREERGKQRLRHAVRLPPEVRMRLSLAPALKDHQQQYLRDLEVAFIRGIVPANVAADL